MCIRDRSAAGAQPGTPYRRLHWQLVRLPNRWEHTLGRRGGRSHVNGGIVASSALRERFPKGG
eukprot:4356440-Pyramimonas_sp.AAC.1